MTPQTMKVMTVSLNPKPSSHTVEKGALSVAEATFSVGTQSGQAL